MLAVGAYRPPEQSVQRYAPDISPVDEPLLQMKHSSLSATGA